ncbi:hypothetical protein MVEN_02376500 [Mycena venus]|uniref:Uncharacterized protein n=1 Tax=Mycena venus TaxID=2733690 RepID=A0A8H6X2N4_9AGAR|nr:hypothetical protein MVEN_02376500 [Mycena venus]
MSKLRLGVFFSVLLTVCHAASGSHSAPAVFPRDGNTTSESAIDFAFAIPFERHGDDFSNWVSVVCLRPDQMIEVECDSVEFGNWVRCPNPDVSGILVRVAAYLANLLLGIVVMYDPEEASGAVWAQLLTVYSLLISAIIAIYTKGLSRFHSGMTVFLVLSPLSATLVVYAIMGFCGRDHRLKNILSPRREHLLPRVLVVVSGIISLALLIFTSVSNDDHFTSVSPCDALVDKGSSAALLYTLIFVPYVGVAIVIVGVIELYGPNATGDVNSRAVLIGTCIPVIVLLFSVMCAVIKSRRSLVAQVKMQNLNKRSKFWAYWKLLSERYPLLHFCGVFLIPMIYWVIVNELRLFHTPDNLFSPSFGQVLAVFVVLQPLLQVLKMIPRASGWFQNLAVVRLITRRPRKSMPRVNLQVVENQETFSLSSWHKLDM